MEIRDPEEEKHIHICTERVYSVNNTNTLARNACMHGDRGSALVQSVNYAQLHSCLQASYFAPHEYALGFYFNRMQDVTGYRLKKKNL